jgi:hypothetical protein
MTLTATPLSRVEVISWLSTRQYVRPHDTLGTVLASLCEQLPTTVIQAGLADSDLSTPIGRITRAQLEVLAARAADALAR